MSPTTATKVAADTRLTPGTLISRLTCSESSASLASSDSSAVISWERKSTSLRQLSTIWRSCAGSSSRQPEPSLAAEDVAHRRAALQHAPQRRVDGVLGPGAGAHQALAPPEQPAQHTRLLIGTPDGRQKARVEQLAESARIDLVRLHLGL